MVVPDDAADFIREQYPQLVGLLGLYCGDRVLAEELAQDALERVCRDWRRVRRKDNAVAWTRRVAINLANSHFRRKAAEQRATTRLRAGVLKTVERDDVASLVLRESVASLPLRQRTAVVLHYFLDMSFPEVAEFMDIPLSTGKSLVRRGLARLRQNAVREEKELRDAGLS